MIIGQDFVIQVELLQVILFLSDLSLTMSRPPTRSHGRPLRPPPPPLIPNAAPSPRPTTTPDPTPTVPLLNLNEPSFQSVVTQFLPVLTTQLQRMSDGIQYLVTNSNTLALPSPSSTPPLTISQPYHDPTSRHPPVPTFHGPTQAKQPLPPPPLPPPEAPHQPPPRDHSNSTTSLAPRSPLPRNYRRQHSISPRRHRRRRSSRSSRRHHQPRHRSRSRGKHTHSSNHPSSVRLTPRPPSVAHTPPQGDLHSWRNLDQPSVSATPTVPDHVSSSRHNADYELCRKAKEDPRRCRLPGELDQPVALNEPNMTDVEWFEKEVLHRTWDNNGPNGHLFQFDKNLIYDMGMVLAKGGILPRLHRERISARRIRTSDSNPTKYWALCVNLEGYFRLLPEFRGPHSPTDPPGYSYTWIHATHDGSVSRILKEGIVRPSMWSFNEDPSVPASDFPAYGFFGVGAVGGWNDSTAWTTLGNNCDIGKLNNLRWILAGTMESNVQHKKCTSGGNWDLQRYTQSHGVAHGTRSKHWTFNSNHTNIKYLITLQETLDV